MTGQQYEDLVKYFRKKPDKIKYLILINKILTALGFISYPVLLTFFIYTDRSMLLRYICVPGLSFIIVSIFRKIWNQPRPYENSDINTLTSRSKKGQSFPSRHIFSYSMISILLLSINTIAGAIMLITCVLLAWIRVVLGVHYTKDVMAGAAIGIICGMITIFL